MKAQSLLLALSAAVVLWSIPTGASAQTTSVEPIDLIVAQNQPIEMFFPNVFDLRYPKKLSLDADLINPTDIDGSLAVFFDWVDPTGEIFFTPVVEFPVASMSGATISHMETIPFCPQQVSLHFRLADAPAMEVHGTFTHQCLVPEPASLATAGLGVVGLALAAWRRRRR